MRGAEYGDDTGQGPGNLTQLLLRAAEDWPDSGMRYWRGTGMVSAVKPYPTLLDEARRLLTGLRKQGAQPGERIVLLVEHREEFLPLFWACLLGGFVPCPLAAGRTDPDRWVAQLSRVYELLGRPLLIADAALAAGLPEVPGLSAVVLERLGGGAPAVDLHDAHRDELAVLVLTSGSTGIAKVVMLTHANLLTSMAAKNRFHRLTAADTTMNSVSFDRVAALLECHMLPLWAGAEQVHVEPHVIAKDPLDFVRLISQFRVTVTYAPNFLLELINGVLGRLAAGDASGAAPDLSSVRHIISGGEAVVCATARAFLDGLAPYGLSPTALWPAFGMAETCAGSAYSTGFPGLDAGQEFANLGLPVDGLAIRVADDADRPLADGGVGELQLHGPMVASGYYGDDRATAAAFTADGWLRSGDLGQIQDGRLTLVGRKKECIIVAAPLG
jgi:acyl-CoA synthetase (AMP-forming)/AMP-acid ligase II